MSDHDIDCILKVYARIKGPSIFTDSFTQLPEASTRQLLVSMQLPYGSIFVMITVLQSIFSSCSPCKIFVAPLAMPGSDWAEGGSDERAECLCTSKPLGQAPVGAHKPKVGGSGSGGCSG